MNVKGTILGLTRNSGTKEICKAALESMALQTRDVIIAMEKDANLKLTTLAVDGERAKIISSCNFKQMY